MGLFSKLFGPQPPNEQPKAASPRHSFAKRILVVDDSITIQKVIELTLMSHRVTAVRSMAEATSALARESFDLVICDVVLADGTGYHVCREAKAKGLPVILMPGTFEPFDEAQARSAGADTVQTKPFRSDALVSEVDRLLAQKH